MPSIRSAVWLARSAATAQVQAQRDAELRQQAAQPDGDADGTSITEAEQTPVPVTVNLKPNTIEMVRMLGIKNGWTFDEAIEECVSRTIWPNVDSDS